jgi:hypothetical protein
MSLLCLCGKEMSFSILNLCFRASIPSFLGAWIPLFLLHEGCRNLRYPRLIKECLFHVVCHNCQLPFANPSERCSAGRAANF